MVRRVVAKVVGRVTRVRNARSVARLITKQLIAGVIRLAQGVKRRDTFGRAVSATPKVRAISLLLVCPMLLRAYRLRKPLDLMQPPFLAF